MALKLCPVCRVMNRSSAERCRCGHVFDPATIVKRKPALRCPLCGLVADSGAAACDCGYDFSTPDGDVRRQLLRRRKYGWFWLGLGLACVGGAGVLWLVPTILPGLLAGIAGAASIARGAHAVSYTRRSLADLDAKALPEARVVK